MRNDGFTLIELMIVVAIMGILATMALPRFGGEITRAKLAEPLEIAGALQPAVSEFYRHNGRFPRDNAEAGIPEPDKLLGNHVARIELVDGALHVHTRDIGHGADGILTLRPQIVPDSPASPVSWVCGHREPAEGMRAVGENRTSIPRALISWNCR